MANTIHHLEAANLFIGDDDPTKSLYLALKNVQLPEMEEVVKEHMGGGAAMGIEMGMRIIKALTIPFKLEGANPDEITRFMPGPGAKRVKYTIRANIRDLKTHAEIPLKGIVEGRMSKVSMGEFDREKGVETDYEIKEIMFYTLHIGNEEKFYFDYFSGPNGVRINAIPVFQNLARNLGLA